MTHCGHGNCTSTVIKNGRLIRCCGPVGHDGPHLNIPGYYAGTDSEPRIEWADGTG